MNNPFQNPDTFVKAFKESVETLHAKPFDESTPREQYHALGRLVFAEISKQWKARKAITKAHSPKTVHYFSMEFLIGRLITNNLMNLGLRDVVEKGMAKLGLDLNAIEHKEVDPGLGNGGLGRLAACFLDSLASLGLPGHGVGIRYRYGLFEQEIRNGYQLEKPDDWLKDQYVWEVRAEEEAIEIPYGGHATFNNGAATYEPNEKILAVPYDIPIVGADNGVVNRLRLWNAEPTDLFPDDVNSIEYNRELRQISGMLYPDDTTREGKTLRIKQQYFFSAAGVRSILKDHHTTHGTFENVPDKLVFQINDTHPALVIPEMMRVFMDDHGMEWDDAWAITTKTCAYTNHTLLAEALEKWPISIFQPVLPRIYQIIEEINRRFCAWLLHDKKADHDTVRRLAIIADQQVRMAHLAIVGSFSVNGVAALHTSLLKSIEMKEWHELYPGKFNNKTNGVTHRRWLKHINPELSTMLDELAPGWLKDMSKIEQLLDHVDDEKTQKRYAEMKRARKVVLAERINREQGISLDPDSIFDVQVKRMHEYKRQLMNALHILMVYNRLKTDVAFRESYVPHSFIFGAKAAGTYYFAKKIIKLLNTIADKVNHDPDTRDLLKVVFVENYNVTYAEQIIPACDLSEQISLAGKEASGTGNMKFMMNGAITIGTLDGANVEIADLVGEDNIIIFGMETDTVNRLRRENTYDPLEIYQHDDEIRTAVDQLTNGFFANVPKTEFNDVRDKLLGRDEYFVLKDLRAYTDAHEAANARYQDQKTWRKMALTNIAKSAFFTTDRTISDYANEIWRIAPIDDKK